MTVRPSERIGGVEVRAQGWGWRHAGNQRWAVRDVDLHIRPGERVLLLGASGSGKSTLLQGLAGLLGGHDEGEEQDPDSQVILSRVGDDVAFGLENLAVPREEIWPRVERALASVGLNLPVLQDTSVLSGGQKQRLALAGVLAMSPGLIILDEPTANLDADGVVEVRDAVRAVADETGATVIVVEHRTQVWLPVVDRVVVLDSDGGVLADGAPDDVLQREREHLIRSGIWIPDAPTPQIARNPLPPKGPLLEASDLAVGHRTPVRAGLDFTITPGRITAVTGPNGAGKSTLALTLGGLIPARSGHLRAAADFAPSPKRREPIRWRSRELLTRIASVFQDPEHQFLTGTVHDEISLGLRALKHRQQEISAIVDPVLERLRLTQLADRSPYTLSGGEKRRLSVATVLVTKPSVVVLDEPTFGQDRRTWTEMLHLLAELADHGTAVVTVTHDDEFVALLADDRIRL
jgi:energy-coupling factor transporter ATP-binding protein EcfA2